MVKKKYANDPFAGSLRAPRCGLGRNHTFETRSLGFVDHAGQVNSDAVAKAITMVAHSSDWAMTAAI